MRSCHFHGLGLASGEKNRETCPRSTASRRRPVGRHALRRVPFASELMLLGWHACLIALRHVFNELFIAKVGQFFPSDLPSVHVLSYELIPISLKVSRTLARCIIPEAIVHG